MTLQLHYYGDPVLREKARRFETVTDDVARLAADMIDMMRSSEGVGLAAQQIGQARAICVIEVPEEMDKTEQGERLNPGLDMPMALLNPEIINFSRKTDTREEGCLSFPEIRGNIDRSSEITVRYMDLDGKARELTAKGFLARVIQHEVDHLNGVLFIDRMSPAKRFALSNKLKRMKRETEEGLSRNP